MEKYFNDTQPQTHFIEVYKGDYTGKSRNAICKNIEYLNLLVNSPYFPTIAIFKIKLKIKQNVINSYIGSCCPVCLNSFDCKYPK